MDGPQLDTQLVFVVTYQACCDHENGQSKVEETTIIMALQSHCNPYFTRSQEAMARPAKTKAVGGEFGRAKWK